jgi:hypothetical protein
MHKRNLLSLPDEHPLKVATRTYSLALSLSLGPAIVSLLTSKQRNNVKGLLLRLRHIVKRELGITGFAFSITLAIGGGSLLQALWRTCENDADVDFTRLVGPSAGKTLNNLKSRLARLSNAQKAFICNVLPSFISILLMHSRSRRQRSSTRLRTNDTEDVSIPLTVPLLSPSKARVSPTLDLTLLFVVRAMDALVQRVLFGRQEDESDDARDKRRRVTSKIDAFVFWASSARCVISLVILILKFYLWL